MSMYSMEDIARFVENDLEADERRKFEEALKSDPDLQSAVSRYRDVHSSLKMKLVEDEEDLAFRQTLAEVGKSYFKQEAKVVPIQRYIAWTSAVAAVFLVLLIWAPWRNNLYQEYAETEMIAMAERGDSENQMSAAVEAFNKKDFSKASVALEQVLEADSANAMVQYYYAITLVETDDMKAGRAVLQKVYEGSSVYKYDAAFYIALSFLKEKDKGSARTWLQKIPQDAGNYGKSQELLNKL